MKTPTVMNAALALAVVALAAGCAKSKDQASKWSGETADMVVYAQAVPLYPGAVAQHAMGSDSYGDTPESHSEGMCVWFEVQGYERDKVLAWYTEKLPNARRSEEAGTVTLTVTPANAEPGEDMGVYVDQDGFRVFENTKPGKH
jgi:hypothetical protein